MTRCGERLADKSTRLRLRMSGSGSRRHGAMWWLVGCCLWLCSISSLAGEVSPGLDTRPENLTCVAPDRPEGDVPPSIEIDIEAVPVFTNLAFENPMVMIQAPRDDTMWYLATREGLVWRFENDEDIDTQTVSLDIQDRLRFAGESQSQQWGVTSLAFHPQFPDQPYLYVAYNGRSDRSLTLASIVARFETTDGGETFAADSEAMILSEVQDVSRFHHLGQIAFGPDGYLYIGIGDADGSQGQDLTEWGGSILRIDVDSEAPYRIPPDNPLVGMANVREEIYAWGMRNPWRFSFDTETGDLWAGDVGGDRWEEINLIVKGGNYGWKVVEGNECVEPDCDQSELIPPVALYDHSEGAAIIGGFVYRGQEIPGLNGAYVHGDSSSSRIWGVFVDADGNVERRTIGRATGGNPHVFIQGNDGELYIMRSRPDPQGPRKLRQRGANPSGAQAFPTLLSQTGCVDPADPQRPAAGTVPYQVSSPLWSDGAEKQRWMALPDDSQVAVQADGDFEFPSGTVLVKTFVVEDTPVETRLLIRHNDGGWAGYSYEWLDDGSDAMLLETGKTKELFNGQMWMYPNRTQCLTCHTQVARYALGPELAQLNHDFEYPTTGRTANQLETLLHIEVIVDPEERSPETLPVLAAADDDDRSVEERARGYLHANCSGCHRPEGPTQAQIDMRFFTPIASMHVCNEPPQLSTLGIDDPALIAPGSLERSIVYQRMNRRGQHQMPPLATFLVDTAAVEVIGNWILSEDICPPVEVEATSRKARP